MIVPRVAVAFLFLVLACDGDITGDNWPTYEVRGTVRTAAGAPVIGGLVELKTYGEAGCGTEPLFTYSSALTDNLGRYRTRQDLILAGVLDGCLRLVAHPDTSSLSQPTATVDLPVDNVEVIEGETVFTVDLTLP